MSRDIELLEPEVRDRCKTFLRLCADQGIQVMVVQTLRTPEEQMLLYQKGRTRPGEPCHHILPPKIRPVGTCSNHPMGATVTNLLPGKSLHERGLAFDFCFGPPVSWEGPWERAGEIGESVGLKWGGRWKSPDRPHLEYRG